MGLDQYAFKARRLKTNENVNDDDCIKLVDGTRAVITDGKWYGRKVNVIQNYMEKVTGIDNCECVYITEDMLDELEDALSIINKAVADDDTVSSLIASHYTVPNKDITYIDESEFFNVKLTDDEAAVLGKFMYCNTPDELMPGEGFFYGPTNMDSEYYLYQLTEVRAFVDAVRPWLTDDTFAVYTCWY